jgi:Spy/CpxP family protein refolding chaperone
MIWRIKMNNTEKNKWQVRGAVLGIFLLGFLAGFLALNVYHRWADDKPRPANNRATIEQTFRQLSLTEAQQQEVRGIFDDARSQMREMRKENAARRRDVRRNTDERLQKVLSAEQWQQFQQIRSASSGGTRRGSDGNGSPRE